MSLDNFVKDKYHKMKKRILSAFICLFLGLVSRAGVPSVGAQVFIEPGQSPGQIDSWFSTLEDCGFKFARIRMFGTHMLRDGKWDFSLYDEAFASAERHGIKVFATLFPTTDELSDVGGFKFPHDRKQLGEVAEYIDAVVGHFSGSPALCEWVLQNEPGTGRLSVAETPLSAEIRREWEASRPQKERTGYLEADYSDQEFLRYYTCRYLGWIAERVKALDPVHGRHINPHQILDTLPEYDFEGLRGTITSLGSSMHFSWHFQAFRRDQYPLGISLMADLIATNSLGLPYWVTEFQGGNVTASGNEVLCPTASEVTQSIWTAVGAGVSGFMFWTLNQRKAVREAGEWGLLNYSGKPSDRMEAASEVAGCIAGNEALFTDATPVHSNIYLLYNDESLWIQKLNAAAQKDQVNEGRGKGAVMASLASAYGALCSLGTVPEIVRMDRFDWSSPQGKVVIMPHTVCIPQEFYPRIRSFVEEGGILIATGLTGYYDRSMACAFMDGWPLAGVFGAGLEEIKASGDYFPLPPVGGVRLTSHLWKGFIRPEGAKVISGDRDGVYATEYHLGKGKAIWLPSAIDLGCRNHDEKALAAFYNSLISGLSTSPVRFSKPREGILMRTMESGDKIITVLVNKSGRNSCVRLKTSCSGPRVLFRDGRGSVRGRRVRLGSEATMVIEWNN